MRILRIRAILLLVLLPPVGISPCAAGKSLEGTLFGGGNWAGLNHDAPVLMAGDLLKVPDASAQATLQLRPLLEVGPIRVDGELWGRAVAADDAEPSTEVTIQRLVGGYDLGSGTLLSLGTRVYHTGTAYVWNPSNPVADPNVNNLDRAFPYYREGDLFAAVEWLGAEHSLGIQVTDWLPTDRLYGPDVERQSSGALRWGYVFDFAADLAGTYARRGDENFASLAASMAVGESLELHAEASVHDRRRTQLPVSRTVVFANSSATFWELAATDEDATVAQAVVGGQYTFPNLTNVILEYFYNGEGYSDAEFETLEGAVAAAEQGVQNGALGAANRGFLADVAGISGRMRRHYLFGRVAIPDLFEQVDLNLFLRWGLDDNARVSGVLARLPLSQALEVRASMEHFGGPDGSEIMLIPFRWRASLALALSF